MLQIRDHSGWLTRVSCVRAWIDAHSLSCLVCRPGGDQITEPRCSSSCAGVVVASVLARCIEKYFVRDHKHCVCYYRTVHVPAGTVPQPRNLISQGNHVPIGGLTLQCQLNCNTCTCTCNKIKLLGRSSSIAVYTADAFPLYSALQNPSAGG